MPPRRHSRFAFCTAILSDDVLLMTEREPFRFRALSDNRHHIVKEGETLFSLAGHYFAPLPRPAGLWWIIADFQPEPIHDPTLSLDVGRVLVIPSHRTITEDVFSEKRREEALP